MASTLPDSIPSRASSGDTRRSYTAAGWWDQSKFSIGAQPAFLYTKLVDADHVKEQD